MAVVAGLQIQDGFVRQQPRPVEERTLHSSRADRNAMDNKWPRMEVILDLPGEGQILSRLKPQEPGYDVFTWGQSNAHWWEEGDTPPIDDPSAVDVPWQEAVNRVTGVDGYDPLEVGVIRITERPEYQSDANNVDNNSASPFTGDLVVLVVSPTAIEFTGRRTRQNPYTGLLEVETVRYSLLDDRILTVTDARGNVVSGDIGLIRFPFFSDRVTDNQVAENAALFFGNSSVADAGLNDYFVGEARRNVVKAGASCCLSNDPPSDVNMDLVFSDNTVETNVELENLWGWNSPAPGTRIYRKTTFLAGFWPPDDPSILVNLDQCLIGLEFNVSNISLSCLENGQFVYANGELTAERSTFFARLPVDRTDDYLNLSPVSWAGLVRLDVTNPDPNEVMTIATVSGLPETRPLTVRRSAMMDVVFQHNPTALYGYQGEDTLLHRGLDERPTLRYDATADSVFIINLETYTPPLRGHVIVQEDAAGNQTIFPQRRDLVLVGAGFQVEDDEENNQTRIINLGVPGDGGDHSGEPGPEGKGYLATATTAMSVTVQAALVGTIINFTIDAPFAGKVAYSAGARVRATLADGSYLEGVATGYNDGTRLLALRIDLYGGGNSGTAWTINLAGEPFRFNAGTVVYSAGKATLDLATGQEFTVDLATAALGGATTVTLDLIGGWPALRSIQIYLKQTPAAPFKTLALQPGKFRVSNGQDVGVPLNRQAANAVDLITGYFYLADKTSGRCSLVFGPNFQDV